MPMVPSIQTRQKGVDERSQPELDDAMQLRALPELLGQQNDHLKAVGVGGSTRRGAHEIGWELGFDNLSGSQRSPDTG
jgi:hypothetical protein